MTLPVANKWRLKYTHEQNLGATHFFGKVSLSVLYDSYHIAKNGPNKPFLETLCGA